MFCMAYGCNNNDGCGYCEIESYVQFDKDGLCQNYFVPVFVEDTDEPTEANI